MPNGRSGGFELDTADLKHLITSTLLSEVGALLADGPGRPKPCSSADVAAAVERCQQAHVYIEEQDGAFYVIHLNDDPILWVVIRSGAPLLAPLRERHTEWKLRRSS